MAVVNVQEGWSGAQAYLGLDQQGVGGTGGATRAFTVLVDDPATACTDALGSGSIPARKAPHPVFTDALCQHKRAVPLGLMLVGVTCEYYGEESPLAQPYERSWGREKSNVPVDRDQAGSLIVNSAGDPLTGITAKYCDAVYTVVRNEATYPTATVLAYCAGRPAISNDAYQGFLAGEGLMGDITATQQYESGASYWRCAYQIMFRYGGWQTRPLDEGPRYITSGTNRAAVKDRLGVEKAKLDGAGGLLTPGAADAWLTFNLYPAQSFVALGLG